jgi:hypothetical protein
MAEHGGSNDHVVALGGGRGLACVLSALRSANSRLTVITSIAADEDWEGDARQGLTGPVGDLRRSLEALSDEDAALLHAIRRPLTVDGVGQHPLGDLTLAAAADVLEKLRAREHVARGSARHRRSGPAGHHRAGQVPHRGDRSEAAGRGEGSTGPRGQRSASRTAGPTRRRLRSPPSGTHGRCC